MTKTPPSKAELDRINKELEQLRNPKPPTPRLSPNGSMRSSRDNVDRAVRAQQIRDREERAEHIRERLALAKEKIEKEREKFREK